MTGKTYDPDPRPPETKFGYAAVMEKRAIRARLENEGVTGIALELAIEREYEVAHANDVTYAEKSAARAARAKKAPAPFTDDELAAIRDRFKMDNDPASVAIAATAEALLAHRKE